MLKVTKRKKLMLHLLQTLAAADTYSYSYSSSSSDSSPFAALFGVGFILVYIAVLVVVLVAMWKVFQKAGRPGWASIIPFYNIWVMFEIAGKPGWWALLLLIPFVNFAVIILEIIAFIEIAKRFGKSSVFGFFGLFLFGFIGWPILGFGKAQYTDPNGSTPLNPSNVAGGMPPSAPVAPPTTVAPVSPVQTYSPGADNSQNGQQQ
jgi:uncharacterized membrane protein YhaH (DUF805 family)